MGPSTARILSVIAGLSLPIPSTRNHLSPPCYLQQGQDDLGINSLPLTNPSTRNRFFLLHGQYNILYSLSQSDYSIRQETSLPQKRLPQSQDPIGYYWPPCAYSIHQEPSLSPLWHLQQGQDYVWYCWPPCGYSIHHELSPEHFE